MSNEFVDCTGFCGTCGGCGFEDETSLPVMVLTDENGKDVTFEKLDVVILDDRQFLILSELKDDDSEEVEVVILEVKQENGEQVYDTVQDEELGKKVYAKFLKQQGLDEEEMEDIKKEKKEDNK